MNDTGSMRWRCCYTRMYVPVHLFDDAVDLPRDNIRRALNLVVPAAIHPHDRPPTTNALWGELCLPVSPSACTYHAMG